MVKEQYKASVRGMKISHLTFGVPNAITMRKQAHIQCISNKLYDFGDLSSAPSTPSGAQSTTTPGATPKPGKKPMPYGVLDPRLGTSQKGINCDTCGLNLADCVGHLGYIDLAVPCFHPGFFKFILNILQTICKKCSRVLLSPQDRKKFFMRLKIRNLTYLEKKGLHKAVVERAKKQKHCPYCGAFNGIVKKVALFKMAFQYEPIATSRARKIEEEEAKGTVMAEYIDAVENNSELEQFLKKHKMELLNPLRTLEILKKIPNDDVIFLVIKGYRPEDLILNRIVVPPACIRPSVVNEFESGSNEDDLSVKLTEIIFVNNIIKDRCQGKAQVHMIIEDWDFLQLQIALYFNSETSGIPFQQQPKKPMRSLVQRLKGKHGRFRGNLSGKRVDFSSRSVISPNPNLQIDEVGVPTYIAKTLTYPDRVTPANIEKMKQLIINGPDVHPGANYVVENTTGNKIFLKFGDRKRVANKLAYGDLVERHLGDGDLVLFNRQPSLHKLSIMCHKAKVHPHRTYQFNECVCTPYNADFDGDEMNLHLLQTEEARAEAAILMGTKNNIITPRNGEPLIAAIQDFITGAFLLTQKNTFFDRTHASQLICQIMGASDNGSPISFPPPAIMKPVAMWTGKQVFSLILKPRKHGALINIRAKGKNYSGSGEDLDVNDSFVVVRNSELLCGSMDKATLGSGSKNNIFYIIMRDFTADEAGNAMWRLARVASWFLANRGFSLGIDDVTPTEGLLRQKRSLLTDGYGKVDDYIRSQSEGKLDPAPGMTTEETLESMILKELSQIRDSAGKSCLRELSNMNSALIMSLCGSKGSLINVSQMVACVGQQALRGQRVPDGFGTRTLPHFGHHDKSAAAKGFVENSFFSGLTPTEFFFHTMAGREGLLDTAVKTAETGYMQRRLIKALEDLVVHYDGSVRNSTGEVVQFIYGDDSLDPASMEANNQPVDLNRLFNHVLATTSSSDESKKDSVLTSSKINELTKSILSRWGSLVSDHFKETVVNYLKDYGEKMDRFKENFKQYVTDQKQPAKSTRKSKVVSQSQLVNPVTKMYSLHKSQLEKFLDECQSKYLRAKLEPGTAVGAVCAQSIGEPTTQMTLKTFHFAGVASMNITQGVPRIKELIDANRNIATPIIRAALMNPHDGDFARAVKMRIEKTTLGQVAKYIDKVITDLHCYIMIWLDLERIKLLKLELNALMVVDAIQTKLKLPFERVGVEDEERVFVKIENPQEMNQVRESLEKLVVKGIPSVKRAAIRIETKDNKDTHYLLIEGTGLRDVLATYGVDPNRTYTNNVLEMCDILGVEAARASIIREIKQTMEGHGIGLDLRHLKLLADMMTYKGEVLGITRHGLAKMKQSALMLASFEQTADHLFEAAYYGQEDPILGVSESIISGMPMKIGTGFFDIRFKPLTSVKEHYPDEQVLFDDKDLHVPFSYEIDPQFAPVSSLGEVEMPEECQVQETVEVGQ